MFYKWFGIQMYTCHVLCLFVFCHLRLVVHRPSVKWWQRNSCYLVPKKNKNLDLKESILSFAHDCTVYWTPLEFCCRILSAINIFALTIWQRIFFSISYLLIFRLNLSNSIHLLFILALLIYLFVLQVALEGLRPTIPPGISPHICKLMRICMNEDPAKRPKFDMIVPILEKMQDK